MLLRGVLCYSEKKKVVNPNSVESKRINMQKLFVSSQNSKCKSQDIVNNDFPRKPATFQIVNGGL